MFTAGSATNTSGSSYLKHATKNNNNNQQIRKNYKELPWEKNIASEKDFDRNLNRGNHNHILTTSHWIFSNKLSTLDMHYKAIPNRTVPEGLLLYLLGPTGGIDTSLSLTDYKIILLSSNQLLQSMFWKFRAERQVWRIWSSAIIYCSSVISKHVQQSLKKGMWIKFLWCNLRSVFSETKFLVITPLTDFEWKFWDNALWDTCFI